jgi:hypothetical protein
MISRATEDTVTSLLKDELQKLGVTAEFTPVIDTPVGVRKPDLLCRNAGVYPIEAKFSERDLIMAIAKVQNDYLKHHKVLGIKGGFAILYPEQLSQPMPVDAVRDLALKLKFRLVSMFPPEDSRPFKVYEGRLPEIAKILSEHILAPPKLVEPSIDYIINSLQESAKYILNGLRHLTSTQLEGFFGGKDVFKNILQYEEGKYPIEELKLAAAYLLVNQLLFYHVLSKLRTEFPEIDPDTIKEPSALNQYFKKVLDVNYRMVFSYDVASLIPPKFLEEVKIIINVISGLGTQKVGGDLLGTIFHDLIPFETRKNVAAFYTNVLAAELLAFLAIDHEDARVADFAVGSGGLLVAAYRRKRTLLKEPFSQEIHRRFVEEELLGIDVMPFAANVAACHLALQAPQYFTDKVNIAIWDSTDLRPGRRIPSVAELKMVLTGQAFLDTYVAPKKEAKGVVSLSKKRPDEVSLGIYDVVIMNPPFTRQERIPEEYKRILLDRFDDYKEYLHGQLGYYGYFIFLADRFLKDGGRMALVLPATVLGRRSAEGLRRLLARKYHIEFIITTLQRLAFSESVAFREILLVARKSNAITNAKTTVVVLKELPRTLTEARGMAEALKTFKEDWAVSKIMVKIYPYSELRADVSNWFKYIAVRDLSLIGLLERLLKSDRLIPFSSVAEAQRIDLEHLKFKDFHGFILYDESRAERKIDVWVLDKIGSKVLETKHRKLGWKVEIPLSVLGRGLRRFSHVDVMDVSEVSDYLILSYFDGIRNMAESLLTSSRELEQLKRTTIKSWKEKFEARKSHLLLARRLYLSSPGTCLIAFYSDKPIIGIDMWCIRRVRAEYAKILTLWLNSTLSILQFLSIGVAIEGPWMKVHDYMLGEILVPDFAKIPKRELEQLLKVFDAVKEVKFPSILDQLKSKHPSRKLIDTAWLEVLGYKGDSDRLLDRLYSSLAKEIELLKGILAEGAVTEEPEEETE